MHRLRRFFRKADGYSLVVVAALFAAFGLSVAAYLDRNVVTQQLDRQSETRDQMSRISQALTQYYYYSGTGYYPCPARYDVAVTDTTFGESVSNCHTGTPSGITILTTPGGVTTELIRGMVPIRALAQYGLDNNDAFDPWNGRIMYVVNRQVTPSGTGTANDYPTMKQATLNATLLPPDFVLVSYGQDHRGAYLRNQAGNGASPSVITAPAFACTGTELRSKNCDGDNDFIVGAYFTPSTASTAAYFDDTVTMHVGIPGGGGGAGGGTCAPTECEVLGWADGGDCDGCQDNGSTWKSIGTGCRSYRCDSGTTTDTGAGGVCTDIPTCI